MRLSDLLLMSLMSLWRRKLRTVLTVLGVVIGTTSIVVMISLGIGFSQSFQDQLDRLGGLTRITVDSPTYYSSPEDLKRNRKAVKLNDAMVEQIAAIPGVVTVLPMRRLPINWVTTGKYAGYADIIAVDVKKLVNFNVKLEIGTLPSDSDKLEFAIGKWAKSNFSNPKARTYEWKEGGPDDIDYLKDRFALKFEGYQQLPDGSGQPVTKNFKAACVGVIEAENMDFGGSVIISDKAAEKLIKKNKKLFEESTYGGSNSLEQYSNVWVKTKDMESTVSITKLITDLGLNAYNMAEQIQSNQELSRNIQMLLGGIGGVAMLVAAISIANTMLMSIYERTREIGVMKVLGCRLSNIRFLFLSEAAMIGLLGGVMGLTFSFALSYILNTIVFAGGEGGGGIVYMPGQMQSVIPFWLALLGLAFSTVVGVLAGLYPSQRAMRLSALAAIRNE